MCKRCLTKPVYVLENGKKLCAKCFSRYFERKVFKTIRKYNLIDKKDKIALACSGGKDSSVLLFIFSKELSIRGFKNFEVIAIDEGIKGYRDKTLKNLKEISKKFGIKMHIFSFKKEFGFTLDSIVKKIKKNRLKIKPCYICGILRRYLLNKKSSELGFTKLVTAHNLDDEAQTIIINQFKGNPELSFRLGPKTGINEFRKFFVQRVKPLYKCSEKEDLIYAIIKKIPFPRRECPYIESFRSEVRKFLNEFEEKHRGTKNSIINGFLKNLEKFRKISVGKVRRCKICKQPSKNKICKTCEIINEIKKLNRK